MPPRSTILARQRAAIEEAKQHLEGDATVQVFGMPELRMLGERFCHEKHAGHVVIYHAQAVTMSNGGFYCLSCGATTEEPDGVA